MAQCFLLKTGMLVWLMKQAQILVTMLEDMANPNPRGGPRGHNYRGSISFRYIRCTVLTATFKFCAIFTSGRFNAPAQVVGIGCLSFWLS